MVNAIEKCVVLVPVYREIEPETRESLDMIAAKGYVVRTMTGSAMIDFARSTMATKAVDDGFAETLWIDSDMVFTPEDVERIRSHANPIVAGLYVKKGREEIVGKFRVGHSDIVLGKGGGLYPMDLLGMGFTLVRAGVYKTIESKCKLPRCRGGYDPKETVVPFFLPMVVNDGHGHGYYSEDYAFCHRAKTAGFSLMADTSIKLGHVHRKTRTWDDMMPAVEHERLEIQVDVTVADTVKIAS